MRTGSNIPILIIAALGLTLGLLFWQPWATTEALPAPNDQTQPQTPGGRHTADDPTTTRTTSTDPAQRQPVAGSPNPTNPTNTPTTSTLSGHVYRDNAPAPGVTIHAREGSGFATHSSTPKLLAQTTSAADGSFTLTITHTPIHLIPFAARSKPKDALVIYTPGDKRGLRLDLSPERSIHGVVLNPDTQPVPNATVRISPTHAWKRRRSAPQPGVGFEPAAAITAKTNAQGIFTANIPDAENWRFNTDVNLPDGKRAWASATVSQPWTARVVLQLTIDKPPTGHRLWGYIITSSGGPVAAAKVRIGSDGGWSTADADGGFQFETVPNGDTPRLVAMAPPLRIEADRTRAHPTGDGAGLYPAADRSDHRRRACRIQRRAHCRSAYPPRGRPRHFPQLRAANHPLPTDQLQGPDNGRGRPLPLRRPRAQRLPSCLAR